MLYTHIYTYETPEQEIKILQNNTSSKVVRDCVFLILEDMSIVFLTAFIKYIIN